MDDRRRGRQILVYIAFAALLVLGILNFDKLLTVLGMLWRIALPLIIGLVIAYILNILMRLPAAALAACWILPSRSSVR